MHQKVGASAQFGDAAHSKALKNSDKYFSPGIVEVDNPLCAPVDVIFFDSSGSVVAIPRGHPRPLSHRLHRTHPSATNSAVPITTPSAPRAMALATSWAERIPPLAISVTLSRTPSSSKEIVHLADGVFNRHRDVLLCDVRRSAGAAVTAVYVDDMSAGGVTADRNHINIRWRRYFR